jgi:hypothetical protein
MATDTIVSNPKFMEVLAHVNTKGHLETTFAQLLEDFEGSVRSVQLPQLVKAFDSLGLMFSPNEREGGFDTLRIVRPIRSRSVAVDEAKEKIRLGESDKIEFKSSFRFNYKVAASAPERLADAGVCNLVRDQALKAVCGLYNAHGGDLFIGVCDDAAHKLGFLNEAKSYADKAALAVSRTSLAHCQALYLPPIVLRFGSPIAIKIFGVGRSVAN